MLVRCFQATTYVVVNSALLEYASTLRQARRMGSVANMIPGVGRVPRKACICMRASSSKEQALGGALCAADALHAVCC